MSELEASFWFSRVLLLRISGGFLGLGSCPVFCKINFGPFLEAKIGNLFLFF